VGRTCLISGCTFDHGYNRGMTSFLPTSQQWRDLCDAWRGRHDNALLHYFDLSRRRRYGRQPLWRRSLPGLLGLASAVLMTWWLFQTPTFFRSQPVPGRLTAALACGLSVAVLVWFAQRVFNLLSEAAMLFSQPGRRAVTLQADTALLATGLTPAEVLVGLLVPLLRPLLPALLVASVVSVLLNVAAAGLDRGWGPGSQTAVTGAIVAAQGNRLQLLNGLLPPWVQAGLLAPLSCAGIALCGLLAAGTLALLAALAGRRMHMDVHAGMVAGLYTFGAVVFAWFTQVMTEMIRAQYNAANAAELVADYGAFEPLQFICWLGGLSLAVFLPLYATRSRGRGLWLVYALPLLFMASGSLLVYEVAGKNFNTSLDPTHWFMDCFMAWSMLAPLSAITAPHPACYGTGFYHFLAEPAAHQFRWPLLVAAQLVLLGGLLRTGLDSVSEVGAPRRV
jgi:hypothetical protein